MFYMHNSCLQEAAGVQLFKTTHYLASNDSRTPRIITSLAPLFRKTCVMPGRESMFSQIPYHIHRSLQEF